MILAAILALVAPFLNEAELKSYYDDTSVYAIYNTKGELVVSDWGCHIPGLNTNQPEKDIDITPDYHTRSVLEFDRVPSMGFDARDRQIGCAVGGAVHHGRGADIMRGRAG